MNPRSSVSAARKPAVKPSSPTDEKHLVALSAAISASGTLTSRVLGLLRDMMTARYFPAEARDAFLVAFRLPNVFRRIFGEGSLGVSFIPVFIEILSGKKADGGPEAARARELAAGVLGILLSVTIALSLLGIIFMDDLLRILLSGEAYMSVPGKFELTVHLARIMFGFLVLISTYAYFMSILNGLKRFAVTAFAPCLFNIALISAAMVSPRFAAPVEVLAWAVMLGGILQMVVLIPGVARAGFWVRPRLLELTPDVARVVKTFVPGVLGLSVMQLSALVNVHFASRLPQGTHSYIYFADRILELPLSLFVVSIGGALLPTLAGQWSSGDREAMGDTINHYIRLIVFVALPAAVGMFVLAQPICEVLFLGREFKYQDAVATAHVIQVYSLGLVLLAGVRILAQGFFAIGNTWFPALAAVVTIISHVLLAWALSGAFGLTGLVSASVASAGVNVMMLAAAYNSWVGSLQLKRLFVSILKFLVCGAVMVGALQYYPSLQRMIGGGTLLKSFTLLLTVTGGALVYFTVAYVLRVPELRETLGAFREKVRARAK